MTYPDWLILSTPEKIMMSFSLFEILLFVKFLVFWRELSWVELSWPTSFGCTSYRAEYCRDVELLILNWNFSSTLETR